MIKPGQRFRYNDLIGYPFPTPKVIETLEPNNF